MKKAIILIVLVLGFAKTSFSQAVLDSFRLPASKQLFELLSVVTPWNNTANPATLSILSIKRFSLAETGYSMENRDIKFTHQPGKTGSFFIGTQGYKKIGNVSFYGSFKYINDSYNDIMYNSTLVFDTWNPYLVADTINGKQTKEEFNLSGAASYKISERFTIAGKVSYLSATGAKHKDPRNLNIISRFSFTPGIMFRMQKFNFGVMGSVFSNTNDVSINVDGNGKYTIFKFNGLGYYTKATDVTTYETRYPSKGYSVGVQTSYKNKNIENLASFSFGSAWEDSRIGTNYRYIDGTSNTESFILTDIFLFTSDKAIQNIELKGSFSYVYGDIYSQTELHRYLYGYMYDSIITVNKIPNAVIISQRSVELKYHYLTLRTSGLKDFEAGGLLRLDYYYSGHYPTEKYGYFKSLNLTASFDIRKTLLMGKLFVSPSFEAFIRKSLSSEIEYVVQLQLIPEVLTKNYEVMNASLYGASFSAEIEKPLQRSFIKTIYLKPEGSYYYSPDFGVTTGSNFFVRASMGFTF
jgi:hypothetical protein